MMPSSLQLYVLLSIFGISVAQLVYHGTDGNLQDGIGIFDDSLENILHLEPLRLRIVPTPVRLDFNQSTILLNDIEDMVSLHFRNMNQEGLHSGKFRAMEFGALEEIRFEPGNSSAGLPSATVVDIHGIDVIFMDEVPDKNAVMKNLQEFINQHDFGEQKTTTTTQTTAQKGTDTDFVIEVFKHIHIAITSIKLTWSSQGYTLAPTPSPVLLITKPPARNDDITDVDDDDDPNDSIRYPLLAGGFAMVVLSLFLVKRYKSSRNSANDSINSNLRRFTGHRNEFDGLDFLYPSIALGSENGAFPTFSPHQSSNIKVHFVDLDNQPISPQDIGEIIITDSVSDISSLGQSENRIVVTYPVQHSLDVAKGFPITNLTRVGNLDGPWALYHETQEGFDRLHDDDDDDDKWVSNQGSNLRNVPQLLRGNADSLRYSSDASSLDIDEFIADQRVHGLPNRDVDLNGLPKKENTLSGTKKAWLHESIRRMRRGRMADVHARDSDQGDDHSSVGGVLRSVV